MRAKRKRRAQQRGRLQHLRGDGGSHPPGAPGDPESEEGTTPTPIIVTGCAAQTDPDMFAAMTEVDLVLGNEEKMQPKIGSWSQ